MQQPKEANITKEQKQQEIVAMFDSIAPKYDLANRIMSCGVDISWRKKACQLAFSSLKQTDNDGVTIADVACGSGDMILHWQKNAEVFHIKLKDIIGLDPSQKMLDIAQKKIPAVKFYNCQANAIPLQGDSIDILSIAYGIRNVLALQEALEEFYRVLKNGGILVVLEFMKNTHPTLLEKAMGFYSRKILPLIGGFISSNFKAYSYLPQSIDNFLSTQEFTQLLNKHGFNVLHLKNFSAGVCSLFIAQKISK